MRVTEDVLGWEERMALPMTSPPRTPAVPDTLDESEDFSPSACAGRLVAAPVAIVNADIAIKNGVLGVFIVRVIYRMMGGRTRINCRYNHK